MVAESAKQQLAFTNEITFNTVVALVKQGETLIFSGSAVTFDFSQVTHCDSSALALLLALKRAALKNRVTIRFIKLPQSLLDLARLCNLIKIIENH